MTVRIICVGNRLVEGDALGPRVYDCLSRTELPPRVEAVDGGLLGINLLGVVDGSERVIFVDALSGFARPGEVVVLSPDRAAEAADDSLAHGAGLAYLLRAVPLACDHPPSNVMLVGAEGEPTERTVQAVASRALALATGEAP